MTNQILGGLIILKMECDMEGSSAASLPTDEQEEICKALDGCNLEEDADDLMGSMTVSQPSTSLIN